MGRVTSLLKALWMCSIGEYAAVFDFEARY